MTIIDSSFDANVVAFDGGAIQNVSDGVVRIKRSQVTRNFGQGSGGVSLQSGTLLIDETTFAGNAGDAVGGIAVAKGTLIVTDSAFVENTVNLVRAAAISNGGTAWITNTTLARNFRRGVCGPRRVAISRFRHARSYKQHVR